MWWQRWSSWARVRARPCWGATACCRSQTWSWTLSSGPMQTGCSKLDHSNVSPVLVSFLFVLHSRRINPWTNTAMLAFAPFVFLPLVHYLQPLTVCVYCFIHIFISIIVFIDFQQCVPRLFFYHYLYPHSFHQSLGSNCIHNYLKHVLENSLGLDYKLFYSFSFILILSLISINLSHTTFSKPNQLCNFLNRVVFFTQITKFSL